MNNLMSLGKIELMLVNSNNMNSNNNCIRSEDYFFDLLPFLFKYYLKGINVGGTKLSADYSKSELELASKINNFIAPQLSDCTDVKDLDGIVKDVNMALPEVEAVFNEIKETPNNGTGGIQALPIIPIVYGLIFLLGVSDGLKNKKK